jgi:trans-aconitate methyltransferase
MEHSSRDTAQGAMPWSESDSETFIESGRVMIPRRDEIGRTMLDLVPADRDDPFTFVDIAAGAGWLSRAALEQFPHARAIVLDGSTTMLDQARQTLASFADRATFEQFQLEAEDWPQSGSGSVRCFMSSLAIHHLDDGGKRALFARLYDRLEPGGALLIADLIQPSSERATALAAREWSSEVRRQSLELTGSLVTYALFTDEHWNIFDYPDPMDTPSRLADQLDWLREAGFVGVDAFWLHAGHAVYGGYRRG